MPANPETVARLKDIIIASLNLEGMTPDMIEDDAPLFGGGLGLDSVDALELVVALEKAYGIKIRSQEIDPGVFASVASMASFVDERIASGARAE